MQQTLISKANFRKRDEKALEFISKFLTDLASNPNFYVLEVTNDSKSISISDCREMASFVKIHPSSSDYKVVYIREAQNMTIEAQNSLLKLLEEPPSYAQFILTVNHHKNLLRTVVSRCKLVELTGSRELQEDNRQRDILFDLLSKNVGERIDWVTKNKDYIKDRNNAVLLLNLWELALRDLMVSSIEGVENFSQSVSLNLSDVSYSNLIKEIQFIKRAIELNYANVPLGIESFLVNLPEHEK